MQKALCIRISAFMPLRAHLARLYWLRSRLPAKTILVMKLTTILLLVACLHTCATGVSQTVNFSGNRVPFRQVITAVEKQTPYVFIVDGNLLARSRPVTLSVKNAPLEDFLKLLIKDQPMDFVIIRNTIVLSERSKIIPVSDTTLYALPTPPITITGHVTGETGEAIAGASIVIKGSTGKGTSTDAGGHFTIEANTGDILIISSIGYQEQYIKLSRAGALQIKLALKNDNLSDVTVNTGYWVADRKTNTGNISKVTSRVIEKQPVINPLEAIYGRMPGVYLTELSGVPGSPITLEIRGLNSLRGSEGNIPLYIIDGVPFTFQTLSNNAITVSVYPNGSSPLNSINTADIESIEILKDADATAIYGSRGANGVVLITTKKGKGGRTKVDMNFYTGFSRAARFLKMLNTEEYLAVRKEAFANDGTTPGPRDYDLNGTWDQHRYTDWQKEMIGGTARNTNGQVSMTGGSDNTHFLFSGAYQRTTTVFPGDYSYYKFSSHLALNHVSTNKKLVADLSVSETLDKNNQPYTDYSGYAALPPNAPEMLNADGTLNWANGTWINPLRERNAYWTSKNNNIIASANLGYMILPGLQIKTNFGFNSMYTNEFQARLSTYYNPADKVPSTSNNVLSFFAHGYRQSWVVEPQLKWHGKLGPGRLEALVGSTIQYDTREQQLIMGMGYPTDELITNLGAAITRSVYTDSYTEYRYFGAYGRINYNLGEKYILNLTGRRDGSSRFGPGKQFANFAALGAAWIFSNEPLIKRSLPFLSFGKLRTSYGTTGNDQIGDYQYLNTYGTGYYYQGSPGLAPTRLFNADFAWEINKKFEAGLELGFLQDRITATASYYHNRSSNQLLNYSLPLTTGFTGIASNLPATVQNTGTEIELTTRNIEKGDFRWTTSLNITIPNNKLIAFPNLENSTYRNDFFIGRSLRTNRFYHFKGNDPNTGIAQFQDYDQDGKITYAGDQRSLRELGQQYFGGISNTFQYKSWALDVFFQFVKQTGRTELYNSGTPGYQRNRPAAVLDRWQHPGDNTIYQRYTTGANAAAVDAYYYLSFSDAGVGDVSFARLKNLALAYKLPKKWSSFIEGRIYIQGQNLLTITKFKGLDPEIQSTLLPPMRTMAAGIQLSL